MGQENYFQQEVNYTISVRLDDVKHELSAQEEIEYKNNSPTPLSEIHMHLWPNAYKNDNTAMAKQMVEDGNTKFFYSKEEQRGFIDHLDFKVDGKTMQWEYDSANIDICKIILNKPLLPGERLVITTPFHVKLPDSQFSRLGHDGQSYQITQWYPKPAVFDRDGWHAMPYLNQGEFYSEFGTFDVNISLPANYVVGATGDLIDNENETEWLNKKAAETEKLTVYSRDMDFPLSDTAFKTLHFHQEKVHDFAWFADKRFHVMKSQVLLPHSQRKVITWAMFTNANPGSWINAVNYINNAVYDYSLWNGDYHYNAVTAVEGALSAGGGMEYPNITVIGPTTSAIELELVIVHEVGHNWFYGILGSNERLHPWMDEGINSFNETRYMDTRYAGKNKNILSGLVLKLDELLGINKLTHQQIHAFSYLLSARRGMDQPVELSAGDYTAMNYGAIVYSKTAVSFAYLKSYLGEALFDSCMQTYFNTWKFKHPRPQDLQKIIEDISGKKMDWFFNDMLKTTKKLDYKICASLTNSESPDKVNKILIKNTGNISGPFTISGMSGTAILKTQYYEGFDGRKTVDFPGGKFDSFKIDASSDMPEISRQNNTLRTKGILKKTEPVSLHFLASVEDPSRTQIFYTPVMGWNSYNKIMGGIAVYNTLLPARPFEYVLMPLYSFGSKDLAGSGRISYNWNPWNSTFRNIQLGVLSSRYNYANNPRLGYQKIMPYLDFTFRQKNPRDLIEQTIRLRNVNISMERQLYDVSVKPYRKSISVSGYYINDIAYELNCKSAIQPYRLKLDLQQGRALLKTSLEADYKYAFKGKNRGFDMRFFAGAFIYNTDGMFQYRMSSWNGSQDYMYDETFLGRSETRGTWSQQMTIREGGFKIPTSYGISSDWLLALNLKSSIPGRLPIRFFVDLGTFAKAADILGGDEFMYDAGVELSVIPDVLNIYFPVFMSAQIKKEQEINKKTYFESVRFELNFNRLNPFTYLRNMTL